MADHDRRAGRRGRATSGRRRRRLGGGRSLPSWRGAAVVRCSGVAAALAAATAGTDQGQAGGDADDHASSPHRCLLEGVCCRCRYARNRPSGSRVVPPGPGGDGRESRRRQRRWPAAVVEQGRAEGADQEQQAAEEEERHRAGRQRRPVEADAARDEQRRGEDVADGEQPTAGLEAGGEPAQRSDRVGRGSGCSVRRSAAARRGAGRASATGRGAGRSVDDVNDVSTAHLLCVARGGWLDSTTQASRAGFAIAPGGAGQRPGGGGAGPSGCGRGSGRSRFQCRVRPTNQRPSDTGIRMKRLMVRWCPR